MTHLLEAACVLWSVGLTYFIVHVLAKRHAAFQAADTRYDWTGRRIVSPPPPGYYPHPDLPRRDR